jgi:2-oxoglutarate dehydrogenase E1 component
MKQKEFLFSANADFLQELYKQYLDKTLAEKDWIDFFSSIGDADMEYKPQWSKNGSKKWSKETPAIKEAEGSWQYNFFKLIDQYRKVGHYLCDLDPLKIDQPKTLDALNLELKDFAIYDQGQSACIENYAFGVQDIKAVDLALRLKNTYGSSIGVEFEHVDNEHERVWLYDQFEKIQSKVFSPSQQQDFLRQIIQVEVFENYLHTKFPGAKRFSIEGGETFILSLSTLLLSCFEQDVKNVVIGMAHRGRLATLATILEKPYVEIFAEFAGLGKKILDEGYSGDVKYHMGYQSQRSFQGETLELSLCYNPSHLESINPVLAGIVRAKQDKILDKSKVLGVLIHGDAAFCGQGVVAESIAMANLEGYATSGMIHVVINNQIGFTANPKDTRSSRYSTEFAKISKFPVLHVNGNDVEAVVRGMLLAVKYRKRWGKDIVLEIFCYRKYGHNEGDEPLYTQGYRYNIIKNKQPVTFDYAEKLRLSGSIEDNFAELCKENFKKILDDNFALLSVTSPEEVRPEDCGADDVVTYVPIEDLKSIAEKVFSYPKDFPINPKLAKLLMQRSKTVKDGDQIDWAIAESMAFASILKDGLSIRFSGQDVGRGTFSHRHSVLHSQLDEVNKYVPLNNIAPSQGLYQVYDSLLSEFAVLGFEYGYSVERSDALTIWEAQFGDFANGAQVIFDQFISSGQSKWRQRSPLVVLLPHGYEGQGPEHSSARIERFLSLAARDNMQIALPSTPVSYFHLLRRQVLQAVKKPLIVFTPKSLLRHNLAVSNLQDFAAARTFSAVIGETQGLRAVNKVIICSGKVYYDLLLERQKNDIQDVAIIRLEQYYPFPESQLVSVLRQFSSVTEFVWCQEEPRNMGAYNFVLPRISKILLAINKEALLKFVGRSDEASPAVGYSNLHNEQQSKLIYQALKT